MLNLMPQIRLAQLSDCTNIKNILGDAFYDDPVMNWAMPKRETYGDFFALEAQQIFIQHQHVYLDNELRGAAMWLPPGAKYDTPMGWQLAKLTFGQFMAGGFKTLKKIGQLENDFAKHKPEKPHYYLHAIGCKRSAQGQGIGSALIKEATLVCDKECQPAYLESSKIENVPLYERHGFEVTKEIRLGDDGPPIWLMWREPRN